MVPCRQRVQRGIARRKCGTRSGARIAVIHMSCVRQVSPAAFANMSAPETALASTARALPRCSFTENDPAFGQIVRRHLDVYAVSNDRSDTVSAHLARSVADEAMLIIEGDAETSVGQDLVDRPLHRYEFFLRQTISVAYEKSSARANSGAEPSGKKWKRSRICV